jgi:hypothetical protein
MVSSDWAGHLAIHQYRSLIANDTFDTIQPLGSMAILGLESSLHVNQAQWSRPETCVRHFRVTDSCDHEMRLQPCTATCTALVDINSSNYTVSRNLFPA